MGISKVVRNSFIAGLALIAPLAITIIVLQFVFNWITGYINPVIQSTSLTQYTGDIEIVAQVLATVIIFLVITLLGYFATKGIGSRLFGEFDEVMERIPVVRMIYSSVRQVSNTLMGSGRKFDRVVLVRWPREDVYTIGFVTNEVPSAVEEKTGEEMYTVFLPMSPNPTMGHLVMIPEDKIEEVDMTVGDGIRLVMTTGMMEEGEKEVNTMESVFDGNELPGDNA